MSNKNKKRNKESKDIKQKKKIHKKYRKNTKIILREIKINKINMNKKIK